MLVYVDQRKWISDKNDDVPGNVLQLLLNIRHAFVTNITHMIDELQA